ncbi:MAG: ABC transporter ATP-binding protein [Candidatus Limnocylindrales bacterium]
MLLEVAGVVKRYGGRGVPANDGVNLTVEAGQVYGLLGHNGAGKTTLVNQIVGLLRPDRGSIRIDGRDVVADPGFARRACSIQPQSQIPIDGLTPRQAIETLGRLRGGDREAVRMRATRLIEALDLGEWRDTDGARLSGGVKRLVSFCMAAVEPGKLVILDEPTNDVDPVRRRLLWSQVRSLADEGSAVLLVTHNVIEAERSVDRLAILDHGRVLTEGTPAELKAGIADELRLELVLDPDADTIETPQFAGPHTVVGNRIVATVPTRLAGEAAIWARDLRRTGRIEEFSLAPATLEDAYVALVGSTAARATSTAVNSEEEIDVRAA